MPSFDEIKSYIIENYVIISLIILLIAVIYINIKVNDLNYRMQQTIMYGSVCQSERRSERRSERPYYSYDGNYLNY